MRSIHLRTLQYVMLVLLGSSLFGCAAVTMPPPTASASTVEKLRTANLAPAMVGNFNLAPGRDPDMDRRVGGGCAARLSLHTVAAFRYNSGTSSWLN